MGLTSAERQRRYIQRLKDRAATPPPATVTNGEVERLRDQMDYLRSDRDRWQERAMKAELEIDRERQRHHDTTRAKISALRQSYLACLCFVVALSEIDPLQAKPRRTPTKV
jgi:hypothetical protein